MNKWNSGITFLNLSWESGWITMMKKKRGEYCFLKWLFGKCSIRIFANSRPIPNINHYNLVSFQISLLHEKIWGKRHDAHIYAKIPYVSTSYAHIYAKIPYVSTSPISNRICCMQWVEYLQNIITKPVNCYTMKECANRKTMVHSTMTPKLEFKKVWSGI